MNTECVNRIRFQVEGRTMVVRLRDDLDHHNAMYIREMADEFMERYPINRIIFDFTGVEFMDSSGIGMIIGRYKKICYAGGTVYVRGVGKNVDRILDMSGLYKLVRQWEKEEVGA